MSHTTNRSNFPHYAFTLVEIMVVVVIIGLLSTILMPQFYKIRARSQDTAVMNNVRQLAAASNQYFLEQGFSVVAHTQLVGSTNYVKKFSVLAAETYPTSYTQGATITVTGVGGARTITYAPWPRR